MGDVDRRRCPPVPLEAVFIGGGGFTLPRYVAATRPGSRSRVLEVDGDLVELVRERLGLRTGPELRVRVGDARVTLRGEPTDSAGLVVGDAFGGVAVPWHLTTEEFARDIRRVLRPDGLYLLNVIDYEPLALVRAEAATLRRGVRATWRSSPTRSRAATTSSSPPTRRCRSCPARAARASWTWQAATSLRDADAPADQLLTPG